MEILTIGEQAFRDELQSLREKKEDVSFFTLFTG